MKRMGVLEMSLSAPILSVLYPLVVIFGIGVEVVDSQKEIEQFELVKNALKNSEKDKEKLLRLLSKSKVTKHVNKKLVAVAHTGARMYKDEFTYTTNKHVVQEIYRLNKIAKWHYAPYFTRYVKENHIYSTPPDSEFTRNFYQGCPIISIPIYNIEGRKIDSLYCVVGGNADIADKLGEINVVDTNIDIGVSVTKGNSTTSRAASIKFMEYRIAANKRYLYHYKKDIIVDGEQIEVLVISEFSPPQDLLNKAIQELK